MAKQIKDITGQRFGRLVALHRTEHPVTHQPVWYCSCDCGNFTYVRINNLTCHNVNSCGCLLKEYYSSRTTHSQSNSRLYGVWHGMINRCTNPREINYKDYGGRGISVCQEWTSSFKSFSDWAYSSGYDRNAPRGKCTLDRIDNNGNYCPENCRWVDQKTQSSNTRKSKCKGGNNE